MVNFTTDKEMFDILRDKLTTAAIADSLDELGAYKQCMRPDIRPVYTEAVAVGRAYTVLTADKSDFIKTDYRDPKFIEIDFDLLKPNDVLVASGGQSPRVAMAGEIFCLAARARGAGGLVFDNGIRDIIPIIRMKFPVFAAGITPQDFTPRLIVIDRGCPVSCGDVIVKPGDIVFGDSDGVVVIPKGLEKEAISLALKKLEREILVREELLKGASLVDTSEKYKIT